LSGVESNVFTREYCNDLAVEEAAVNLFPANNGLVRANAKLTTAIVAEDVNFVGASKTANQNSQVIVTNTDIENASVETENGGKIGSNGLTNSVGIGDYKSDVISTSQVGKSDLSIERILESWARVVSIKRKSIFEIGKLNRIKDGAEVQKILVGLSAGIDSELDIAFLSFNGEINTSGLTDVEVEIDVGTLGAEVKFDNLIQRDIKSINAIFVEIELNSGCYANIDIEDIRRALADKFADALLVEEGNRADMRSRLSAA
jgi:hypothetical protein